MRYLAPKDLRRRFRFLKVEYKKNLYRSLFFDRRLPITFRLFIYKFFIDGAKQSSLSGVRNRCIITGRGRGVYSFFGLSRFQFKKLANLGILTGIEKTGW